MGYVKNLPEGRLGVVAYGNEERDRKFVEKLLGGLEKCRVTAPYHEPAGRYDDFYVQ